MASLRTTLLIAAAAAAGCAGYLNALEPEGGTESLYTIESSSLAAALPLGLERACAVDGSGCLDPTRLGIKLGAPGATTGAVKPEATSRAPARVSASTSRPIAPKREALTPEREAELVRTNAAINRAIRQVPDIRNYGQDDVWAMPLTGPRRTAEPRGDCEDFALEKRAQLLAQGWAMDSLSIAMAISPRVGLHAVLIVHTEGGDIVLDNLYDRPLRLAELDYAWVSLQTGADLRAWYAPRRVVRAPAPVLTAIPNAPLPKLEKVTQNTGAERPS
jgi:predicted transglutaminase-like cysteine proteinase